MIEVKIIIWLPFKLKQKPAFRAFHALLLPLSMKFCTIGMSFGVNQNSFVVK